MWGVPTGRSARITSKDPTGRPGMAQNDLLDFSTVLGSMQHACTLAVWCFAVVAIALTAARSLAAESGRAERWTHRPAVASGEADQSNARRRRQPEQHSEPERFGGNSLRDRIRD